MARIKGSVVLVTGANRGLGRAFVEELLARGAAKVYAAARDPQSVQTPGAVPIRLDVNDPAQVAAAAEATGDVDILINNAGSSTGASVLTGDVDDIRLELETHFFGPLRTVRAFAPQLARHRTGAGAAGDGNANGNGAGAGGAGATGHAGASGGAVLNVLSALSWLAAPTSGGYCAAKSAAWSLTNSQRLELADQGVAVTALHVGYMDTDMTRAVQAPKSDPATIAALALDGVEAGAAEVLADDTSIHIRAALSGGLTDLYPALAELYSSREPVATLTG
ncbi:MULTISPECIES: SDR family oxidoreductase [unclassified Parafrankia]|uniref:SDR family oxidoreductase n=1 Tax=unclassified Parafrankia TaxID=2994368 RepID=UPI000DA46B28|nr:MULTISPECIES: SDR family oxidoreductase [unclassified Parafrankia]TCJ36107.1 SDR family NAD(P)-dependent oxidoreductase [Parafrankia sp. BMG5.11]CAI7977782.1 Short-chain dehydrogenase/reductase SDR [Frankia sp. Hr75.2]SQD96377.1 Short-chain dehydrogenase/reductase SDR [Parafrankia sp. Ea1.12]